MGHTRDICFGQEPQSKNEEVRRRFHFKRHDFLIALRFAARGPAAQGRASFPAFSARLRSPRFPFGKLRVILGALRSSRALTLVSRTDNEW